MTRKRTALTPDEPLRLAGHRRPVTRREFLAQGFIRGLGLLAAPSVFSLFANPHAARASLSPDLEALKDVSYQKLCQYYQIVMGVPPKMW